MNGDGGRLSLILKLTSGQGKDLRPLAAERACVSVHVYVCIFAAVCRVGGISLCLRVQAGWAYAQAGALDWVITPNMVCILDGGDDAVRFDTRQGWQRQ